jgi:hypothetical protein
LPADAQRQIATAVIGSAATLAVCVSVADPLICRATERQALLAGR